MDAPMRPIAAVLLTLLLIVSGGTLLLGAAPAVAAGGPAAAGNVTGNITGPSVIPASNNETYFINGTGGPAIAPTGERVGNLTWYATVSGTNTSGVTVYPTTGKLVNDTPGITTVEPGSLLQTLTLTVEIASTNASANETANITLIIHVVQPYTLVLELQASRDAGVAAFNLTILLDGSYVGKVHIPSLTAWENYTAEYEYATLSLGSGWHTFTASLVFEHGLVTFPGGSSNMSVSFYVPGAPPSYTLWYVAGIVAFFGALFIFLTRVAARRRSPARK